MILYDFYEHIGYPCDMLAEMNTISAELDDVLFTQFYQHRNDFFDYIDSTYEAEQKYQVYMKLYMQLLYQKYEAVSSIKQKEIIKDGMLDLLEWGRTCHHYYHVWGIMPNMWRFVDRIIDGRIIHLGRLQFELKTIKQDIETESLWIPEGTVLINVHIPKDGPLLHDECMASYEEAVAYFHCVQPVFHCDSWLLSPQLKRCLDASSNILQFQKDYQCYLINDQNYSMIERVWIDQEDEPDTYVNFEEDTQLQRNAKKLLLNNEYLQSAAGIFQWKKEVFQHLD